jgi:phosphoribosylanthranilate isomerase
MALRTLVKVGNITNLSDARYCAGMNVDLLGFVTVEDRENYLAKRDFQDIRGWFSGPKVVAEVYGLKDKDQFKQILEDYRPDYIELSEAELPIVETSLPLLLRADVVPKGISNLYAIITRNIADAAASLPPGVFLFADTNDASHISQLLDDELIQGIVLQGTTENSPGLKEYDHLAGILETLEVE